MLDYIEFGRKWPKRSKWQSLSDPALFCFYSALRIYSRRRL